MSIRTGTLATAIAAECQRVKKEHPELPDKEIVLGVLSANGFKMQGHGS
jgi:hypothetical protein